MTEQEFLDIRAKSNNYNYSSMQYLDYVAVANYNVLIENEKVLLMYGYNAESKMNEYHWAANIDEELISVIRKETDKALITFIPLDWISNFEKTGFKIFATWNDYFMNSLEHVHCDFESEFLNETECENASLVTISCKGQSRGFTGQTTEWMEIWLKGEESSDAETGIKNNAVIVHRNNYGEIVGLVCTATYAHVNEKGPIVWIREVAVKIEYQRQGIARNLILQALSYGKKQGAIRAFLAADECNKYAIRLYESIGFVGKKDTGQNDMFK
ncbi:GNAT family N-acetyltransferase [Clostridium gasigenes]|uniref:GNAT family N-acetyltransferase n=1 Tax=Clostridium gasigenes TaxID=94869 RepID=UPI001438322B|nr:GNAT family N-acetyltransferase [Clostridium gasigenes]NKF06182.1 GNAT family N-acetyltransferase [Clostridium gasigenes]QSW20069.1 GNAT family N-acetyltransferase [Clostridium gasigenes]